MTNAKTRKNSFKQSGGAFEYTIRTADTNGSGSWFATTVRICLRERVSIDISGRGSATDVGRFTASGWTLGVLLKTAKLAASCIGPDVLPAFRECLSMIPEEQLIAAGAAIRGEREVAIEDARLAIVERKS